MNWVARSLSILVVALAVAGCGEPQMAKPVAVSAKPFRAAGDFNDVGKVSLSEGESCASQIMFIFHGARPVSMAAPFHVSKILTEASHDHKTVRVSGKWRRGKAPGCNYVEATQAEVQKSF